MMKKLLVIGSGLLLLIVGVFFVYQEIGQKVPPEEDIYGCDVSGNVSENTVYCEGVLGVEVKEGITEDTLNQGLEELGLVFKKIFSGHLFYDRSRMTVHPPVFEDDIEAKISAILEASGMAEAEFYLYEDRGYFQIYFPSVLSSSEQVDFNLAFAEFKNEKLKINWHVSLGVRRGEVEVPVGREEEYINILEDTGLFEWVERESKYWIEDANSVYP